MGVNTETNAKTEEQGQGAYIVDYYAVLGLEHTADAAAIKHAYRELQTQYHPDKYAHLAEEMQRRAASRSRYINDAYEVLSDSEQKTAFDAKLAAWTGPVSKDGVPIVVIDMSARYATLDDAAYAAEVARQDELAASLGVNETIYDIVKQQAEAEGADEKTKTAYADLLKKRHQELLLREGFLRDRLGTANKGGAPVLEGGIAAVVKELEAERQKTEATIRPQLSVLAEQKLLPGAKDEGVKTEALVVAAEQQFLARYDENADKLIEVSKQLEEIHEERLDVASVELLHPSGAIHPQLVLFVRTGETTMTPICFICPDGDGVVQVPLVALGIADEAALTVDNTELIAELDRQGVAVLLYAYETELDPQEQLAAAITNYFDS